MSDRSRCGAVPILELAGEPSAGVSDCSRCGAVPILERFRRRGEGRGGRREEGGGGRREEGGGRRGEGGGRREEDGGGGGWEQEKGERRRGREEGGGGRRREEGRGKGGEEGGGRREEGGRRREEGGGLVFLGYHIQPGFVFKTEYLVAPLYEIHNAIENDAFKVFRTKRLETLEGDFVYPLVDATNEPSRPPNLDDQHHNVIEDRNPHPPLEEGGKDLFDDINFDNRPLSEFYKPGEIREYFGDLFDDDDNPPLEDAEDNAAREGESEEASKAKKRAALLDDVPRSIKKNLATVSAPAPPHGYFWNGECLIKKKGNNRPDGIEHSSWRNMSKRQRAEAVF